MNEDRNSLDDRAAEFARLDREVHSSPEGSIERNRAIFQRDLELERFVPDAKRCTNWNDQQVNKKIQGLYNLSSGQQAQAAEEHESAMLINLYETITKPTPVKGKKIRHYINKKSSFQILDVCLGEAKGKRRTSTSPEKIEAKGEKLESTIPNTKETQGKKCGSKNTPKKPEIYFPETSGDKPIVPDNPDSPTILDTTLGRSISQSNRAKYDEISIDLEFVCGDTALRSRSDVTLYKCLLLIVWGYSLTDIAREYAPSDCTEREFNAFYSKLKKWLTGKQVRAILAPYLGVTMFITLVILTMVEEIAFYR